MDRSIILSMLGLLLIISVLVSTPLLYQIARKWQVDTTASLVNTGNESISDIIKPPQLKVVGYGDKSVIIQENLTAQQSDELFVDSSFRDALARQDKLLLYTSKAGVSVVIASYYFNDVEVGMLEKDARVLSYMNSSRPPGVLDISYIEVYDPTNARVELAAVGAELRPVLVPYNMTSSEVRSAIKSEAFGKLLNSSMGSEKKSLVLYRPPNSNENMMIPLNFTRNEVQLLAKNSAVKNAMQSIDMTPGATLNLEDTKEFSNIDLASLPYHPNTRIYTSFNIRSELGFLSEDVLIYLAIFVVLLVVLYVLYAILVA